MILQMLTAKLTRRTYIKVQFKFNMHLNDQMAKFHGKYSKKTDSWSFKATEESLDWLMNRSGAAISESDVLKIFDLIDKLAFEKDIREMKSAMSGLTEFEPIEELQQICKQKVRPCQWVPVYYAQTFGPNFLLADDMRVGKSLASLLITKLPEYRHQNVLITCPATVVGNWQEAIKEAFGERSIVLKKRGVPYSYENASNEPCQLISPDVRYYICTYKGMQKQIDLGWFFIFDESHKLKNWETEQSTYARNLTDQSETVMVMTGTPVQNRAKEMYPQLWLIRPKIRNAKGELVTDRDRFMSKSEFKEKFCDGAWTPNSYDSGNGSSNESDHHRYLKENFMVRRLKEHVNAQLPARMRQTIYLSNKKLPECNSALQAFSFCSQSKSEDPNFLSWIKDTLTNDDGKVLMFCTFQPMMKAMAKLCDELGMKYLTIHGKVPVDDRTELIRRFKNDLTIKAFLLSITAASDGINLSAADKSIFCDQYWNPEVIHQAEERTFCPNKQGGDLSLFPIAFDYEYDFQKMLLDKLVVNKQIHDGLSVKDFGSKRSLIDSIAAKYGMKTGFELRKEKVRLLHNTVDDNMEFGYS